MGFSASVISPSLVGRTTYLHNLSRLFHLAAQGQGQIALVGGEAGIGKTRLVTDFKQWVRTNAATAMVVEGACYESEQNVPYTPLLALIRPVEDESASNTLALDSPYIILRSLLLYASPTATPPLEKWQLHQAWMRLFEQVTASNPVLLILEDMHWCDTATLEVLTLLLHRLKTLPLLIVLTYRYDEIHAPFRQFLAVVDRERVAHDYILPHLTAEESETMVRAIVADTGTVPIPFYSNIYRFTEGNPFFIEELLKALLTSGEVIQHEGRWEWATATTLQVPRSVLAIVQRRSKSLSQEAYTALRMAAVLGRRFEYEWLRQLLGYDDEMMLRVLREVVNAQLMVEESANTFAFRHALTRQAFYSDMFIRERVILHKRIATLLEETEPTRWAELAYHFYEAHEWHPAAHYAHLAGNRAIQLHAPYSALEYFTRALQATQESGAEIDPALYQARAQLYETVGDFEGAERDYQQAITFAQTRGQATVEIQSTVGLGFLWMGRDWKKAAEFLHSALALARQAGDAELLAHTLNRLGNWYVNYEQQIEARKFHEEALTIFSELSHTEGRATTLDLLGLTTFMAGDFPACAPYYEQAIALFRSLDDRRATASSLTWFCLAGGNYMGQTVPFAHKALVAAQREGEEAIAISRSIGWRAGEAGSMMTLALALGARGAYEQALNLGKASHTIATEIDHGTWIIASEMALGRTYLELLAYDEALRWLEPSFQKACHVAQAYLVSSIGSFLMLTYLEKGEIAQAKGVEQTILTAGVPPLSGTPGDQSLGRRLFWLAQTERVLAQGEIATALHMVETMYETMLVSSEITVSVGLWWLYARILQEARRYDEAYTLLLEAQKYAKRHELGGLEWRVGLELAKVRLAMGRRDEAEALWQSVLAHTHGIAEALSDLTLAQTFIEGVHARAPKFRSLTPRQSTKRTFEGLTEREREIAVRVALGDSNQAIADGLILSKRTVDTHITNILNKLGFNSRTQIVRWVTERGLIKDQRP